MLPRILYIMGDVGSGSAVLDALLGTHPEIQSTGDLSSLPALWTAGGVCACGRRIRRCPFWSKVVHRWQRKLPGTNVIERYAELCREYERTSSIPFLWQERSGRCRLYREYNRLSTRLFRSILSVGRKPILIDSSKTPARALALSVLLWADLYLIHLVRDGRAVVYTRGKCPSKTKRRALLEGPPASTWRASLRWRWVNALSEEIVRQARVPALRVRYEDILGAPVQVADRIGSLLNLDLRTIGSAIEKGRRIPVGHLLTTGPSPMGRDIRLSPCLEWKTRLGRWDRRIFRFWAGETAAKYGYFMRPGAAARLWGEGHPQNGDEESPATDPESPETAR